MTTGGPSPDSSPAWLPGGRRGDAARTWWRDLARAVEALRERYPQALADLPAEWWRVADLAEQLGAVCAWRLDLDGGRSADPREELDFHEALERLGERLGRRARSALLEGAAPGEAPAHNDSACTSALEQNLRQLPDEPDLSFDEAFFAPHAGRPGFCRRDGGTTA